MKIFLLIMVMIAIMMIIAGFMGISKRSKMTPQELNNLYDKLKINKDISNWGSVSPAYICPHCQEKGLVRTMPIKRKKGISGAKATGAVLTLGFSILATGLSRKESLTQAHCGNCNSTWDF